MFKTGEKVLVRVMECTSKEYDQWEVVYKTGIIVQENILTSDKKRLCTVKFSNGEHDYAWSNHVLKCPKEWLDSRNDLC